MELTLFGRADCGLCDRLEAMLAPLLHQKTAELIKRDITDDPAWFELYRTRIPVLVFNGRIILEGRPSENDVSNAMTLILNHPQTQQDG